MRRAIGITLERHRRHRNRRSLGEPLLDLGVLLLALVDKTEPPAIVVDHDRYVVRVVEGRRRALKGSVVEGPPRRGVRQMSFANSRRYFS